MGIVIHQGDCLEIMKGWPDGCVNCCVTSPPYWGLRDYGIDGQLGLEKTPQEYVEKMVAVFREVKRVLRDDGTLWLNLGDSYNGSGGQGTKPNIGSIKLAEAKGGKPIRVINMKPKDLVGIPWMVAFALRADGWYLRQDIIWHKPNPMPESVTDRCTKAHEYIFLMAKSEKYFYDYEAIREQAVRGFAGSKFNAGKTSEHQLGRASDKPRKQENGQDEYRNKRSVWTVTTKPCKEAHFATFPHDLITPCVRAGCPEGGTVLDPFMGAGTTGLVAVRFGRKYVGCELNPAYSEIAERRINAERKSRADLVDQL